MPDILRIDEEAGPRDAIAAPGPIRLRSAYLESVYRLRLDSVVICREPSHVPGTSSYRLRRPCRSEEMAIAEKRARGQQRALHGAHGHAGGLHQGIARQAAQADSALRH